MVRQNFKQMKLKYSNIFLLLFLFSSVLSQRSVTDISNDWAFRFEDQEFQSINLPHTYNDRDPFDDEPGYFRGKAMYRKILNTDNWNQNKEHFIRFYAVNQLARVWLNGQLLGGHKGGYTAFVVDVTKYLTYRQDTLLVEVDNSHDESIPPLKGDFNFYGGIYRGVEHISVSSCHFDVDYYGADGVFIEPVAVAIDQATLKIRAYCQNYNPDTYELVLELKNQEGELILTSSDFNNSEFAGSWGTVINLHNPILWSDSDPYLYSFKLLIKEKNTGKIQDEKTIPYGLRYFKFDAETGFFLNDKHLKLIGVNRHQDRPGIGNALTVDQHIQDMDIIREMGANFLRTAHYPQDQVITDYCDGNGILVSMEIPLDHEISDHPEFAENCMMMIKEMIYQNYNHPSVIIWAYMNEMGLWKDVKKDSLQMTKVANLARELDSLIRKTDPYRYTMMPNHGYFDIYPEFGLTDIPMIIGWNLYHGWYVPDVESFGKFVDRAHRLVPDKPIIITEYGAGADPRITSFNPKRFDFSLNWALNFHRSHLDQILKRDFIAGSAVWNMFDFGSEARKDAVPHINNKGLCSFDRKPKAPYYLYQKYLRPEIRVDIPYPQPEYILVDKSETKEIPADFVGEQFSIEEYFNKHSTLNINFGTDFYFDNSGITWIPDSSLPSSFMSIQGGERGVVRDVGYGTDHPIDLTEIDPVYQTWVENPKVINFFLPEGRYKLILHLSNNRAEKSSGLQIQCLSASQNPTSINTGDLSPFRAYQYQIIAEVRQDITLYLNNFDVEPFTFLNGIQIIRL